ncbi:hypothetical protein Dsin_019289 [Dipteronia sinensis]|uniref:Reverse transcriptase domain-containing protein n=1 Tax=Dipteronia sinensis TaxID=43782 RepID=A0AAE0E2P6_9ROSI|nr:hypothetical protein Dsin_019289 [Dipteronia sinensis]
MKKKKKNKEKQRTDLSTSEKELLEVNFCKDEVWETIRSCDGNKEPGPDGVNLKIVQSNWEVIQKGFMNFIWEFYNDSSIVKDLNNTFIALIPKRAKPETMLDFRFISLVGSMYKLLVKVLAYWVKKVMSSIIGEFQMVFVKDHQILDSFVVTAKIIHGWKNDRGGGLLVKLDFEKAYDSVDHEFLDSMMVDMGFEERWRRWIHDCISSPALSVLVNGSPTTQFGLERRLRQRDLLSLFFFSIVVERFSSLLRKVSDSDMIKGIIFGEND